jgi:hypothetical protein
MPIGSNWIKLDKVGSRLQQAATKRNKLKQSKVQGVISMRSRLLRQTKLQQAATKLNHLNQTRKNWIMAETIKTR